MNRIQLAIVLLASCGTVLSCSQDRMAPESGAQRFTAGIDATRTSITDGVNVVWTPGDVISVYDGKTGASFVSELSAPSLSASYTGSGAKKGADGFYYAVYPCGAVYSWNDATAFYTIPNVQTAVEGQAPAGTMVMSARTSDLEKGMMFSHKAAYVRFTVDGSTEPFVSFQVVPVVGKNISGGFKINMSTESMSLSNDGNSTRYQYVELRTSDGKPFAKGTWYVALYPQTFDEGLIFRFTDADGCVCSVGKGDKITLAGGDVLDIGTVKGLKMVNYTGMIGNAYDKDGDKGVIFKVDPAKGTATILSAWSTPKSVEFCSGDASALAGTAKDADNGAANTAAILASDLYRNGGLTWALTNCAAGNNGFGEGWYMPARYQLSDLYDAYYGLEPGTSKAGGTSKEDISGKMNAAAKNKFDDAMASFGALTIDKAGDSTGIWSSTLNSASTDAWIVRFNATLYTQHKTFTSSQYVRCMKDVKL